MPIEKDQVCILIPTLNEAPTIGPLIREFRDLGYSHIFVIDGNSIDETRSIASREGARVEVQSRKGKGNALIEAFSLIEEPYILMIDGDGTYSPQDAEKVLEPLSRGYGPGDRGSFNRREPGCLLKAEPFREPDSQPSLQTGSFCLSLGYPVGIPGIFP